MRAFCRNKPVAYLSGIPAYVSVAALAFIGAVKTTAGMSGQNLWLAYGVPAILCCAVLTWAANAGKTRPSIVDAAAAAMFVWYTACYYINDSIAGSRLLETCLYVPLYVSLRILLSSYRNIGKWLFSMLCICGIAVAVIGIQQAFGARYSNHGLFNVTGTFFNPGPYGGYIAVILSLASGYAGSRYGYAEKIFGGLKKPHKLRIRRILWMSVFAVAVCAVIAIAVILPSTMSRAAFVAAGTAVAAMFFTGKGIYNYITGKIRRWPVIGAIAALIIVGGAYGIYALKKDSADGRLLMWKMAGKVMIENPLTGVGQGYYRGAYADVQAEYFSSGERSETEIKIAGCPEYGFNEYLHTGAETGIPGLLLFVFLIGAALWKLLRTRSYFAFGLIALLAFAFFSYPFSILPMKILFVIFLAAAGSCSRKRRKAAIAEKAAVGIILSGCVFIAAAVIKPYIDRIEAAKDWQEQRHWYSMEFYSYVLDDYPDLFPLMKEIPEFLFEYGRSLNMEGRYPESLDVLALAAKSSNDPMYHNVIGNNYKALGKYDEAADAYLKAYYIIPHRIYPLYLLGKMYAEIGDEEKARHYALRVVEMVPKVESPATRDMQQEMKGILENTDTDEK